MSERLMTKEAFCAEFIQLMCARAGFEHFDDGTAVEEYAEMTAPTYWEDQHKNGATPADCVEADMSYWGEE